MTNVPEIRVAGFDGEWQQGKVSECANLLTGNGLSWGDVDDNGERECILYGNLYTDYGMIASDVKYRTNANISNPVHSKYGDVLIPASDTTPTGLARATSLEKAGVLIGGDINILRPVEGVNGSCLSLAINANKNELLRLIKGTTVRHIHNSEIKDVVINLPGNESEQIAISGVFRNLDNLISQHQHKNDTLVAVKKAMLEKMFPKEGENTPEIRFAGFTDSWEQRKLESLCDVFTDGDWIESKDQSESGVRLVQTGNVGTTQYLDKEDNKKWISEDTFEKLKCKEIFEGDILISRLPEPAGRACIMPNIGTKMITAVDCTIVRTLKEYDSKYLVQYLSTPLYFKNVNSFLGGGTRQRISRGNLAEISIPVPVDFDEQVKIGEYFANLDNLITLHQRKCEVLKNLKTALLSKMFVSTTE